MFYSLCVGCQLYCLAMEARTPKMTQIVLTGLGLFLFALAMTLNHFHPRNQGIAELTHGAIYKKLGISDASNSNVPAMTYVSPLPKASPKPVAKMTDPTSDSAGGDPKSLPTAAMAGQTDQNSDDSDSSSASSSSQNAASNQNNQPPKAGENN
jgi:hypothetical protein